MRVRAALRPAGFARIAADSPAADLPDGLPAEGDVHHRQDLPRFPLEVHGGVRRQGGTARRSARTSDRDGSGKPTPGYGGGDGVHGNSRCV